MTLEQIAIADLKGRELRKGKAVPMGTIHFWGKKRMPFKKTPEGWIRVTDENELAALHRQHQEQKRKLREQYGVPGTEEDEPHTINEDGSVGKPGETPYSRVLTQGDLKYMLANKPYSIISAGPTPAERGRNPFEDEFHERHEQMRQDLEEMGIPYVEVFGHYGGPEQSFMVFHDTPNDYWREGKQAVGEGEDMSDVKAGFVAQSKPSEFERVRELGKKYGQHSVIHSAPGWHEMHFVNEYEGEEGKPGQFLQGTELEYLHEPTGYFSRVDTVPTEATTFQQKYRWDRLHDFKDAMLKSINFLLDKSVSKAEDMAAEEKDNPLGDMKRAFKDWKKQIKNFDEQETLDRFAFVFATQVVTLAKAIKKKQRELGVSEDMERDEIEADIETGLDYLQKHGLL